MIKITGINLSLMLLITLIAHAQSHLVVSAPFIYSSVKASNNWSPPTAIHRKDAFQGASLGRGLTVLYSFHPEVLIRNSNVNLNVGIGYFKQRFNLERPFDYNSPLDVIFYTDHYAYDCWQAIVELSYSYPLGGDYWLSGSLSGQWMRAFREKYTLRTTPAQTSYNQIDFGRMILFSIGFNRDLGKRFLVSAQLLAPIYTRWRNDAIFNDDPTSFSKPQFSLGSAISLGYYLKDKKLTAKQRVNER